jgi:hypothetical protein
MDVIQKPSFGTDFKTGNLTMPHTFQRGWTSEEVSARFTVNFFFDTARGAKYGRVGDCNDDVSLPERSIIQVETEAITLDNVSPATRTGRRKAAEKA